MLISRFSKLKFILCTMLSLFSVTLYADIPFRQHRSHHFATLVPAEGSTVFIGNSITNMHEWREAFGGGNILNRGISGAYSEEVLENLESYIINRPEKVFLMIGTNDLGTNGINVPAHPYQRICKIVNRIRRESPTTEIYVQSLLPSTSGLRTAEKVKNTNALIRDFCEKENITYIDLYQLMVSSDGETMPSDYSFDNLHCAAQGYSVWCKAIEEQVGHRSVYPGNTQNKPGNLGGPYGMRLTVFAQLPVASDDILMFGDEVMHGGEWAELLGNSKVKSRGTGWGYPGPDIATLRKHVVGMLKGRTDNASPAKIFIYAVQLRLIRELQSRQLPPTMRLC